MRAILFALSILFAGPALAQDDASSAAQPPATQAPATDVEAIHAELRALRDRLVDGVNAKDPGAIIADVDEDILFTAMNNEVVHGKDEARAYYEKMLVGSQRIVEDMSLSVEVDDLSTLLADGDVAVAAGSSVAHFDMMVGDSFDVPLRWTATLNRTDGGWKVAAIHFSANIFDNPISGGFQTFAYMVGGIMLLIGLLLGWFFGRRRRTA